VVDMDVSVYAAALLGLGDPAVGISPASKVKSRKLQRTPEQVEELKRLAQEKRDRKAARLNRGK
jgi:hypothetical protein